VFSFLLNGKYIIINNKISTQDEQRPVKENLCLALFSTITRQSRLYI
jgi:hypothetical protein